MPLRNTDPNSLPHTRAEIQGTVQLLFAENAVSAADAVARGYLDLGNFLGAEIKADPKRVEKKSASRGVVFTSGTTGAELTLALELMTKEVADERKLKILLMADAAAAFTQAAVAGAAVDPLAFTAQAPARLDHAYPITDDGVRVREISACAIVVGAATLEAGVDYVLDAKLGLVRFIKTATLPAASAAITITAPAIDAAHASYMLGLQPMRIPRRRGYAHVLVWDQDEGQTLVQEFEPRPVELVPAGGTAIDHEKQSEFKLTVNFVSNTERVLVRP